MRLLFRVVHSPVTQQCRKERENPSGTTMFPHLYRHGSWFSLVNCNMQRKPPLLTFQISHRLKPNMILT